jgi:hypothetical protein
LAYFLAGAFLVSLPPFFCAFDAYYSYYFFLFCYSKAARWLSNWTLCFDINSPSFSYGFLKSGWETAYCLNKL